MEEQILNHLFKNCYTKADLLHHLSALESFLEFYFFQNQAAEIAVAQKEYFLKNDLLTADKEIILSYPPIFYSYFNLDNFYELIAKTRDMIEKMEKLTICLPFEARSSDKAKIGKKAAEIFTRQKTVVEFKFDPSIIAGCAFIYRGVYKDYSLASILEKRGKIVSEIITSYA